jgi:murein DD-endopeptidase MepM/ murein hydrolase activator NlpD
VLAATVLAVVLGPHAPAVADQDDVVEAPVPTTIVPEVTPEPTPVEATPSPTPEELTSELSLGTRLTALGVMRLEPNPRLVAAAEGERPTHLLWPVAEGHFGRGFGYTRASRPDLAHFGVDVNAPEGSPVLAAADGMVVYAGDSIDGFGNFIVIVHPNGWGTSYAHNSRLDVVTGQQVHRGDQIGLVGQTGLAHGPHVHFEYYVHGVPSDPTPLFQEAPPNVMRMVEHAELMARLHPRHRHAR